jgi:hypothetical protein
VEQNSAMSWVEAVVRTRFPGVSRCLRRRERAEGIASQAVIIGVTAVVGTAIVTAFMNGLGQVFTAELKQISAIVPGG